MDDTRTAHYALMLIAISTGCADRATSDSGSGDAVDLDTPAVDSGGLDAAHTDARDAPAADARRTDAAACPPPLGTARPWSPPGALGYPMDDVLRMNHMQLEGTHNSYHIRPDPYDPSWDYTMAPLGVQLSSEGVRQLELDVHWDARCMRYEVYHIGIFDELSTCHHFTDCLQAVRDWSDDHPGHHPLFVHIEPKDMFVASVVEARMQSLEGEVLSIFPRESIITPDEVQGAAATLSDAVTQNGWPTLAQSRGRVLFYIDNTDTIRDVYTRGRTSLAGRLMFIDSDPGEPIGGIVLLNDALPDSAQIEAAVRQGYIVRTFAESSDTAAMAGDTSWLDAGLAAGAQILSTDYPAPVAGFDYYVQIPGGTPTRCNPIVAPAGCTSLAIEDPARLGP